MWTCKWMSTSYTMGATPSTHVQEQTVPYGRIRSLVKQVIPGLLVTQTPSPCSQACSNCHATRLSVGGLRPEGSTCCRLGCVRGLRVPHSPNRDVITSLESCSLFRKCPLQRILLRAPTAGAQSTGCLTHLQRRSDQRRTYQARNEGLAHPLCNLTASQPSSLALASPGNRKVS